MSQSSIITYFTTPFAQLASSPCRGLGARSPCPLVPHVKSQVRAMKAFVRVADLRGRRPAPWVARLRSVCVFVSAVGGVSCAHWLGEQSSPSDP